VYVGFTSAGGELYRQVVNVVSKHEDGVQRLALFERDPPCHEGGLDVLEK
jgi:hypothetical protein